jgi:hypothetical protein
MNYAAPFNAPGNGSNVPNPGGFAFYDGASGPLVYFNGEYWGSNSAGNELISTDGTELGTTAITSSNINPSSLAVAFGELFLAGDNSLYAYDGSASSQPVQVARASAARAT